jgi:hypothetical protein
VEASRLEKREAATLPITATPRVPPNRRVASLTAEPAPALASGTAPMMASVAGALAANRVSIRLLLSRGPARDTGRRRRW